MNIVEREKALYGFGDIDRLIRKDWGIFDETQRNWIDQGWDKKLDQFLYDESSYAESLVDLVTIDLPLCPLFEEKIIAENEQYYQIRTIAGSVEQFKKGTSRLTGEIMPLYLKAPVESENDWYDVIKPRLDPDTPERWVKFREKGDLIAEQVRRGEKLYQASTIGGYMYLRSLMGPEKTLLAFYDYPDMVHDMMRTWAHLVLTCLSRVQKKVPFFKLLMGEDIAYKNGMLISPAMAEEFLFPYYREVFGTLKAGQSQVMHLEVDCDGHLEQMLPLYREIGFDVFGPFEVAAGNDVVEYGKKYPDIIINGGFDKRILASSKEAIQKELERIMPYMVKRGGYIPTCDHNIPSNVPYENYLFYRRQITSMDAR